MRARVRRRCPGGEIGVSNLRNTKVSLRADSVSHAPAPFITIGRSAVSSTMAQANVAGMADMITARRFIDTTVEARNGGPVLGRLVTDNEWESRSHVPVLDNILVAHNRFQPHARDTTGRLRFVFMRLRVSTGRHRPSPTVPSTAFDRPHLTTRDGDRTVTKLPPEFDRLDGHAPVACHAPCRRTVPDAGSPDRSGRFCPCSGQPLIAVPRLGPNFAGDAFCDLPPHFASFDHMVGEEVLPLPGRIADDPAPNVSDLPGGLLVSGHVPTPPSIAADAAGGGIAIRGKREPRSPPTRTQPAGSTRRASPNASLAKP